MAAPGVGDADQVRPHRLIDFDVIARYVRVTVQRFSSAWSFIDEIEVPVGQFVDQHAWTLSLVGWTPDRGTPMGLDRVVDGGIEVGVDHRRVIFPDD